MGVLRDLKNHLKHRLNPKTIGKEVFNTFTDKVIPQGADEVGNVLMTGSAYLPWPGKGQDHTVPAPEPQPEVSAVQSEPVEPPNEDVTRTNPYFTNGYEKQLDAAARNGQFRQKDDNERSR